VKLIRKIINYFNKEVPNHPIETFNLLKRQLKNKYQLENDIKVYFHNNHIDYKDKEEYDKKIVKAIIDLSEKMDVDIDISKSFPSISAKYDTSNGFTAFTKDDPTKNINFKMKE